MINETTYSYLRKKLVTKKSFPYGFEDLSRETGVTLALQLVYIWQLINLMAAGVGQEGQTLDKEHISTTFDKNNTYDNDFDPIDLILCLLIQEFHDNDEEYFSLNIMKVILSAYEVHMDNVTLGLRLKKLVSTQYLEQSKFSDLNSEDKKLISNNNRIKIVYRLHPAQKKRFDDAYIKSKDEDFTVTASASSPLGDYMDAIKKILLLMPDEFKQDLAEELVDSIKD
jgi:hypothetical protein